jgi:predicted secreted hydrolase
MHSINFRRRLLIRAASIAAMPFSTATHATAFPDVVAGQPLRFPHDEGSHPEFRTEWWYVTGWLDVDKRPLGFQITFFRTRPHKDFGNPSRFAANHLLIAHAAISQASHGRLRHDQRVARAGFELAEAAIGKTDVWIDDWYLRADGERYVSRIESREFALALTFSPSQPHLLQGTGGYSRKGPDPRSASYYYSLPHLRVRGRVRVGADTREAEGLAWLDHEWSSQAMDNDAVGWDWAGVNLDDGAALMVFQMRSRTGSQHWAAATMRDREGRMRTFAPSEVTFTPLRHWVSARTGARYPIAMRVRAGDSTFELIPMMDDQENDTRLSTGAIYWEGAVTAGHGGRRAGLGYLELTGYAKPLKL